MRSHMERSPTLDLSTFSKSTPTNPERTTCAAHRWMETKPNVLVGGTCFASFVLIIITIIIIIIIMIILIIIIIITIIII